MELWTTEYFKQQMGLAFKTRETLYHAQSEYQTIDIVDTEAYGRLLLLDGAVMTTDRDEFVYHEMISHVPMLSHPNPKRVLVVGGGDGGTVREVVKHPSVESIVLCEIDGLVVDSCKRFFPQIAGQLDNPKVTVRIQDAIAYVAEEARDYDIIIVDSTDPIGPGEGLFTEEFYRNVYKALTPDGIMVAQTESPFVCQAVIQKVYPLYQKIFPIVKMYTGHIPTYPSGFWTWAYCSKQHQPVLADANRQRAQAIEATCQYYNAALHDASFVLPNFVQALIQQPVTPV